ncbi:unnamed protein product [Closterium sp. NIES-65]|nr:unnamed protein product [Closterium sp. NIES-65]
MPHMPADEGPTKAAEDSTGGVSSGVARRIERGVCNNKDSRSIEHSGPLERDQRRQQRIAVEGIAVEGIAVEGIAVEGIAVEGIAVEGIAVEGIAVEGLAVEGIAVEGDAAAALAAGAGAATVGMGHVGWGAHGGGRCVRHWGTDHEDASEQAKFGPLSLCEVHADYASK